MEENFLEYLSEWESAVDDRDGLSPSEKNRLLLSRETIEGLRITGKILRLLKAIAVYE